MQRIVKAGRTDEVFCLSAVFCLHHYIFPSFIISSFCHSSPTPPLKHVLIPCFSEQQLLLNISCKTKESSIIVGVYVTWNNRCVCVCFESDLTVMWCEAMWVELVCGFWSMIGSLCGLAMPPCIKRKPLTHTHAYFFIADCINRSPWLLSFLWVSTCVCVCPCRCLNHQK